MLLSRLSKQAMRATPEEDMGMSIRHFMALHSIPGAIPQRQLGEIMCIDANNTVILLNELEALGWIVRERDPQDRRRTLVWLSPEGFAVLRADRDVLSVAALAEAFAVLPSGERDVLLTTLSHLVRSNGAER